MSRVVLWGLVAALLLIAFDYAMDADAANLCATDATATDAVCRQAGVIQ